MQQIPYEGPTNIGRNRTKFFTHGDPVPGIFVPLFPRNFGNKFPTTRPNNPYKNHVSL